MYRRGGTNIRTVNDNMVCVGEPVYVWRPSGNGGEYYEAPEMWSERKKGCGNDLYEATMVIGDNGQSIPRSCEWQSARRAFRQRNIHAEVEHDMVTGPNERTSTLIHFPRKPDKKDEGRGWMEGYVIENPSFVVCPENAVNKWDFRKNTDGIPEGEHVYELPLPIGGCNCLIDMPYETNLLMDILFGLEHARDEMPTYSCMHFGGQVRGETTRNVYAGMMNLNEMGRRVSLVCYRTPLDRRPYEAARGVMRKNGEPLFGEITFHDILPGEGRGMF